VHFSVEEDAILTMTGFGQKPTFKRCVAQAII
jgi:hypothetical protein